MKRIFKKPEDKTLNTGVRTSFVNLKDDVFRVQVVTPYMFDDVINEPIVDLQECTRCNVKDNPDFMFYDICEHCHHEMNMVV